VSLKLWQLFVLAGLPALAGAVVLLSNSRPEAAPPTRDAIVERTPKDYGALADASSAQANVRAAVPALEAYRADTGAYSRVTPQRLRARYDAGIRGITVVRAATKTYCIESTVGGSTFHKAGPSGEIAKGHCS
jgi:hypothetical protein